MKRFFLKNRRSSVCFESTSASSTSPSKLIDQKDVKHETQHTWSRNILNELRLVESQYVESLELLSQYFLEPWSELKPDDEEVKSFCSIVRGMTAYHRRLEKTFQRMAIDSNEPLELAKFFCQQLAFLQCYSIYVDMRKQLEEPVKHSEDVKAILSRQIKEDDTPLLPFQSYIVKPLHHLSHYISFLGLLRQQSGSEEAAESITEATQYIAEIIRYANIGGPSMETDETFKAVLISTQVSHLPQELRANKSEHHIILQGNLRYENTGQSFLCFLLHRGLVLTVNTTEPRSQLRRRASVDVTTLSKTRLPKFERFVQLNLSESLLNVIDQGLFSIAEAPGAPHHFFRTQDSSWLLELSKMVRRNEPHQMTKIVSTMSVPPLSPTKESTATQPHAAESPCRKPQSLPLALKPRSSGSKLHRRKARNVRSATDISGFVPQDPSAASTDPERLISKIMMSATQTTTSPVDSYNAFLKIKVQLNNHIILEGASVEKGVNLVSEKQKMSSFNDHTVTSYHSEVHTLKSTQEDVHTAIMMQLLGGLKDLQAKGFLKESLVYDNLVIEIERNKDERQSRSSPRNIFANAPSSGLNILIKRRAGLLDVAAELLVHILGYLSYFKTVKSFHPSHAFRDAVDHLDETGLTSLLRTVTKSPEPIGTLVFSQGD